ncbi:disease resistance protein [Cucumis melo var. makuwa]|uniref:Disease resistance protein n=1 Tax=Cucumis melo var. makuwa TaxID=1194695 RepID=A0A5A7VM42_CUCMM|nr:disease resistance protein [Cucumis melo var. makuwa]TYJ97180.1 disease resistance protein [Cucumis melo var. makuwa]
MKNGIKKYVEQCDICQRNKFEATKHAGVLQLLPILKKILEDWTMDFTEGLPLAGGLNVIMVVVDRLSKYAYFITLRHPFSAKQVAKVFIDRVIGKHGIPKSMVSDRDKIFLSNFWRELFAMMGTILKRSAAFHPQTDGQSKRVNRCLETYLRPPPPLLSYGHQQTPNNELETMLKERDLALNAIKENLCTAQNGRKKMADQKRIELKFKVEDEVYLKLRPYRQHSLARKKCEKLAPRYYGPYRIKEEIGKVAYCLELPLEATIHDVFHISQLKLKLGKQQGVQHQHPMLTEEFELLL